MTLALLLLALAGVQLDKTKKRSTRNGPHTFRSMRTSSSPSLDGKSNILRKHYTKETLLGVKGNIFKKMNENNVNFDSFEPTKNKKLSVRGNIRKREDIKNLYARLHTMGLAKRKQDLNVSINKSHLGGTNFSNPTEHNVTNNSQAQQGKQFSFFNNRAEIEYENYLMEKKYSPNVQLSFRQYMTKFDISRIMEKITSETSNTIEQFMMATELMDPTADLLKLKIEPINPNPFNFKDNRRAWIPPSKLKKRLHIDMYSLRPRIYFLMQQSLYQARDHLIEMQQLRNKYRNKQVYKMGYVIARADHLAQLFAGDSYKAIYSCGRQWYSNPQKRWDRDVVRVIPYEYYDMEERLLNHWFELTVLMELIAYNHVRCVNIIKENKSIGNKTWFED